MFQHPFPGSAVASADDERTLGARMRQRGHVDEVLVVEELVHLGGNEMDVEPEKLAEVRGVVPLDRLVRRAELLVLVSGADEESPRLREVFRHQARGKISAVVRRLSPLVRPPFRHYGSNETSCAWA